MYVVTKGWKMLKATIFRQLFFSRVPRQVRASGSHDRTGGRCDSRGIVRNVMGMLRLRWCETSNVSLKPRWWSHIFRQFHLEDGWYFHFMGFPLISHTAILQMESVMSRTKLVVLREHRLRHFFHFCSGRGGRKPARYPTPQSSQAGITGTVGKLKKGLENGEPSTAFGWLETCEGRGFHSSPESRVQSASAYGYDFHAAITLGVHGIERPNLGDVWLVFRCHAVLFEVTTAQYGNIWEKLWEYVMHEIVWWFMHFDYHTIIAYSYMNIFDILANWW